MKDCPSNRTDEASPKEELDKAPESNSILSFLDRSVGLVSIETGTMVNCEMLVSLPKSDSRTKREFLLRARAYG
jgi:hypothetical protein